MYEEGSGQPAVCRQSNQQVNATNRRFMTWGKRGLEPTRSQSLRFAASLLWTVGGMPGDLGCGMRPQSPTAGYFVGGVEGTCPFLAPFRSGAQVRLLWPTPYQSVNPESHLRRSV